ncbi:hypothetical protein E2C01_069018 [Portunus trituberculatus]|uniref:Uncharacterized protein n=1 Tax=Portunus trituberculatus TaxID=210409 RepID=A0A5B7HY98_PORTR|nr:hypothetical protein [Portunus trituberculatus]
MKKVTGILFKEKERKGEEEDRKESREVGRHTTAKKGRKQVMNKEGKQKEGKSDEEIKRLCVCVKERTLEKSKESLTALQKEIEERDRRNRRRSSRGSLCNCVCVTCSLLILGGLLTYWLVDLAWRDMLA